jgi:hypothetical protein
LVRIVLSIAQSTPHPKADSTTKAMIGHAQICRFKNRPVVLSELEMLREPQVMCPAGPRSWLLRDRNRRFKKLVDGIEVRRNRLPG